jgi:molybdopterin/thiamine biosynthesis adenylyltransferase
METKNLNRIINSRLADARAARPKVTTLARAVRATGLVRKVLPLQKTCFAPDVIKELASCDILFGCMDSYDGRDLLNRLASFYCVPLFDLGVHLEADGQGGVSTVCGSVHCLLPGGSSLLSRGVYTAEDVRVAALKRSNPEQFQAELDEGYIKRARVSSPAVVSVNGLCATMAINNLLARLHPFRNDPNSEIRWQTFDLVNTAFTTNPDGPPCGALSKYVGRGDMEPLLNAVL